MPTVVPGYWECPRCKGREVYFAKREVGTIGTLIDLPNGPATPGIARSVEKDVALCYECRERANWIPPRTEFSEEELKTQARNSYENRYRNAFISGLFFFLGAYILYYPFSNLDISETWAIADIVIGVLTMFIAGALAISSLRTKKPSE